MLLPYYTSFFTLCKCSFIFCQLYFTQIIGSILAGGGLICVLNIHKNTSLWAWRLPTIARRLAIHRNPLPRKSVKVSIFLGDVVNKISTEKGDFHSDLPPKHSLLCMVNGNKTSEYWVLSTSVALTKGLLINDLTNNTSMEVTQYSVLSKNIWHRTKGKNRLYI